MDELFENQYLKRLIYPKFDAIYGNKKSLLSKKEALKIGGDILSRMLLQYHLRYWA
jgi:hypothetical protein